MLDSKHTAPDAQVTPQVIAADVLVVRLDPHRGDETIVLPFIGCRRAAYRRVFEALSISGWWDRPEMYRAEIHTFGRIADPECVTQDVTDELIYWLAVHWVHEQPNDDPETMRAEHHPEMISTEISAMIDYSDDKIHFAYPGDAKRWRDAMALGADKKGESL